MVQILDGKLTALEIKNKLATEVRELMSDGHRPPHLAAILVGDDGASQTYVAGKEKAAHEVGFTSSVYRLPANATEEEVLSTINFLNNDDEVDGFIVQLPLPSHISEQRVIDAITPEKDVDGFTPISTGRTALGDSRAFKPATPMGIVSLLERYNIETDGKHCVVVGRSNIVGTPAAILLSRNNSHANCTVTLCHTHTHNLAEMTRQADILIVAVGKPELITADMVKPGAVVIDVGIHRIPDETKKSGFHLCGDVKHSEVDEVCSFVTPVPGGVGPLTIVSLLQNTMKAYHQRVLGE